MYQALYRKWRPKVFADVVGQDPITQTLRRQVAEGRTSHAYLFTGTRGTGKTTCAKILAKAVNCENSVDGDPCCQCPSCLGIENGSFLDVLELDAASNNGVDQVRALRDEAIYSPAHVKKRVYIIDEVHMLSTAAFNALLKILEEPPEHLMFVLATTELHKVPATILSRCQRFSFRRILPEEISHRLSYVAQQEGIDLRPEGAELLSRLADGALRDGLSLLDQCAASGGTIDTAAVLNVLGLAGAQQTVRLMGHILSRQPAQALSLLEELYAGGKDVGAILGELSVLARDLLILRVAPKGGDALLSGSFDRGALNQLGSGVNSRRLLYLTSTLQKASASLYYSTNRRTDAELCLLRLCDESLSGDLEALESRISRMEERLEQGSVPAAPPAVGKMAGNVVPAPPLEERRSQAAPSEKMPSAPAPAPSEAPPWEEGTEQAPALQEKEDSTPASSETDKPESASCRAPAGGGDWSALVERCKGRLPPMYRPFLGMCGGTAGDGVLTVYAPDDITLNRLDNDRVRTALQEEAQAEWGTALRVVLQVGQPPAVSTEENLKNLLAFGSQFDNFEIK